MTDARLAAVVKLFRDAGREDVPGVLIEAAAGFRDIEDRRAFVAQTTDEQIRRLKALATPAGRLELLLEDIVRSALAELRAARPKPEEPT